MAATLFTPMDEFTGLPLPIAPRCEYVPLHQPDIADIHHGVHPRSDARLKTLGGSAFRNCQIQILERDLHNEGPFAYHRFIYGLEDIPTDDTDIFTRCVTAVAGYTPLEVIDLTTGELLRRPITRREYDYLRTPSEDDQFGYRYIGYRYEPIRDFFRQYVRQQRLDHIRPGRIDEFLNTQNGEDKLKIGRFLLRNAAAVAGDRARDKYTQMLRSNLLHPAMPTDVHDLVYYKLGSKEGRDQLLPGLAEHLAAAA